MRQIIKKVRLHHVRQVAIYGVVGLTALAAQMVAYLLLCDVHVAPLLANVVGNGLGMVLSYHGHTRYTFARNHRFEQAEFMKYCATSLIGLGVSSLGIYIVVHVLKLNSSLGIIPMVLTPGVTFLISKFWAFR